MGTVHTVTETEISAIEAREESDDIGEESDPEAKKKTETVKKEKPHIPCLLKLGVIGCGLCTGIVSQMLFTNMTFFQHEFPGRNPEFAFPLVLVIPQVVGQLLSIKFVN